MVPENAIKLFLSHVRAATAAGAAPNARVIGEQIFGEPSLESTIRVVDECRRRGLLSRADADYTVVVLSPAGEAYLAS